MQLIFDVDPNWFVLFFGFFGAWAVLIFYRKRSGKQNNFREQVWLAAGGLTSLVLMELFATQTDLWHYLPGDWPIILWPTYVAAILFGHQLLRFIEERVSLKDSGVP